MSGVHTCVHLYVSVSVLCWPSWVCRSCEHLLLSVWGLCGPLPQSRGPAWVQKPGDPGGHWTNNGALPHRFRPPQSLPIADGLWQPDDGHSAEFLTQSSSGKLATRHWAGQHKGSESKENREHKEDNRDLILSYRTELSYIHNTNKKCNVFYKLLLIFPNQKKVLF